MGERKVINKYYPPDFDPSKILSGRKRQRQPINKQTNERIMLPIRIQCSACRNYMAEGKKFNSRKETVIDETYLSGIIKLFRFYFKCSNCSQEIIMKTDPRNSGYVIEAGARELCYQNAYCYSSKAKQEEEEEEECPVQKLERKAKCYKQEMEELNRLYETKSLKSLHEMVSNDEILRKFFQLQQMKTKKPPTPLEDEDEELVRSTFFIRKRVSDSDLDHPHPPLKRINCSDFPESTNTSTSGNQVTSGRGGGGCTARIIPNYKLKLIKKSSLQEVSSVKNIPSKEEDNKQTISVLQLLSQNYNTNDE